MTIEGIEAREKAATPEPWHECEMGDVDGSPSECYVYGPPYTEQPDTMAFSRYEDADFIAHSRQDIPYLLAQLRDRDEKLAALEKELASAPPSPRIRRMEGILHPKEGE